MINVKFDTSQFDRETAAMLNRLHNASYAFNLIAAKMEARALMCFQSQRDPDGKAWDGLSETTEKLRRKGKRKGHGNKILRDTDTLMNSIRGSAKYNNKQATVGTDIKYARIHNEGGPANAWGRHPFQMPKRQFLGMSAADIKRYNKTLQDYVVGGGI